MLVVVVVVVGIVIVVVVGMTVIQAEFQKTIRWVAGKS